jgi:3-oxoacyl-[acyl-carrier-protein] synthase-1
VVVLACDAVDSFVLHGFHQLRVVSLDRTRPFASNRSGFHLGDAAACVLLSKKIESEFRLVDARIDSEGHAATRPSHSGESLLRAARQLHSIDSLPPELVIAHGTSTQANDVTEDRVFTALFAESKMKPAITGTKWSIGHTLGAAGLIDVIAAVEVLKSQKAFSIFTTDTVDSAFESSYLVRTPGAPALRPLDVSRVLVTSLGFGGVHAAALVGRA